MSEYSLRKAIANLKKLGLIHTAQHWITSYKRVMFYRIDYDRLASFIGDNKEVCDRITSRCANNDQVDVQADRNTNTDTPSSTSLEQKTGVVASNECIKDTNDLDMPNNEQGSRGEVSNPERDSFPPTSSGK